MVAGVFGPSLSVRMSVRRDLRLSCRKSASTDMLGVASMLRGRLDGLSGDSASGWVGSVRTLTAF
jgi:hypothetical protein